jgi:hypothetical protein
MSKTKELYTQVVPMVACGLVFLCIAGVLPAACIPRAAAVAAAQFGVLSIVVAASDWVRERNLTRLA